MAEVLIARGALVDEPDAEPWATPRSLGPKNDHQQVVSLLNQTSGSGSG